MGASITHEVLGHGGACLLRGGRVTLVSSVYFRSQPPSHWVDVAGPLASLLVGLGLWGYLRRPRRGRGGLVAWFTMTFSLCWCAGYFLLEALTNLGDLALPLPTQAAEASWRGLAGILGVLAYHFLVRRAALGTWQNTLLLTYRNQVAGGTLLAVPYVAASLAAFTAAAWYAPAPGRAIWEASGEILGAASPLFFLAHRLIPATPSPPLPGKQSDKLFYVGVGLGFLGFCLLLGRGLGMP